MIRILAVAVCMCLLAGYGGYLYGKSRTEVKIIEKQVEVIKYVAQKKARIQARPHAGRRELLELMRASRL